MASALQAIDTHVHPMTPETMGWLAGGRLEAARSYFKRDMAPVSIEELADQYRARRMMAVLLATDDSTTSGLPPVSNDLIARAVRDHPDVFIGFAGIDPWKGKLALDEARRAHDSLGLRGLKFNPGRQQFAPNDPRFYPIWEAAAGLGLICLFHSGMMGAGAGTRGGLGFKLKYGRPIPELDDIAADFPELTIISAHPAWPWQDEQLALAQHKANVYIDLSGWAPRYFSPQLIRYADRLITDRVLFGSDWPVLTPERWLEEFDRLALRPEAKRKILLENAARLFGIPL